MSGLNGFNTREDAIAGVIDGIAGKSATVWDACSDSGRYGTAFKRHGFGVISSDVRPSALVQAAATIGTNANPLTSAKVDALSKASPKADGWFVANEAPRIGMRNARWADALVEALPSLTEQERKAATFGVVQTMEKLLRRGEYADITPDGTPSGGWHVRDADLAAQWRLFFKKVYPQLVRDNGRNNPCHLGDAIALAPSIVADVAFFDLPVADIFASYKGRYDLTDEWCNVLLGIPSQPPHGTFVACDDAISNVSTLMGKSVHVPAWIFSYAESPTMTVTPEDIAVLAEAEGRTAEIVRFRQDAPMNRAGHRNECLIVCRMPGTSTIAIPTTIEISAGGHGNKGKTSPSAGKAPTGVTLFSGLGGTDIALEAAGYECVFACEKDDMARKVFEANFGHVPHPDVRTLDPKDVPSHDLLQASWPCQALSIGGLHQGMDDDRCQLALEIVRIIAGCRPKALLLENANTLPTHDGGKLLEDLLSRFAAIGYHGWWSVLDASDFGLPTQRKRTYVVLFRDDLNVKTFAFPTTTGKTSCLLDVLLPDRQTDHLVLHRDDVVVDPAEVTSRKGNLRRYTKRIGQIGPDEDAKQGARIYSPLGSSVTICSGGGGLGANTGLYLINGKVRSLHPREAARALGFQDSFLLPESEHEALRLIGNSVAVPVVAMIAREIARTLGFNTETDKE